MDGREDLEALLEACLRLRQARIEAAAREVPRPRLMELAGSIGLPDDDALTQVAEGDLAFLLDLAVYDARPGRGRPIDRAARRRAAGTVEALLQRALGAAWCSAFRILQPHPVMGQVAEDVLRGGEVWLLDPGMEAMAAEGVALVAGRVGRVRGFCVSTGALGPLDATMLAQLERIVGASGLEAAELLDEPRFVALLYRNLLGLAVSDTLGRRPAPRR